jgi:rubrerythrin
MYELMDLPVYSEMMADQHMFSSVEEPDAQPADVKETSDALKPALQFEKDSVIFFLGMHEAACEGRNRDLITLFIKEEQDHVRRLSLEARRIGY